MVTPAREAGNLSGMDLVELSRLVENLLRIGTIHSVDHAAVRCRVQTGKLVTDWLRWHTPRAGETRTWNPPTVGEQALVLSPSGEPANGVVFYGFNCTDHPAPSDSPDKHITDYPDGAFTVYDHVTHTYRLDVPSGGSITLRCGESWIEIRDEHIQLRSPRIDLN